MTKQRSRKNAISDALTLAMGRVAFGVLLAILGVGLPIFGLYQLSGQFDYAALRWIFVGLVLAFPTAGVIGFGMARLEVKGFLGGFDKGLVGLAQAVDLRDNSKIRVQKETRAKQAAKQAPPDISVYLPPANMPQIAHRQLTTGDVIEL